MHPLVTLEINGREERHQEITFVNEKGSLQPVFSVSLLEALGVNVGAIPAFSRLQEGETFTHLEDFIPAARTSYDFNQQRLFLSLPQATMALPQPWLRAAVAVGRWYPGGIY